MGLRDSVRNRHCSEQCCEPTKLVSARINNENPDLIWPVVAAHYTTRARLMCALGTSVAGSLKRVLKEAP